MHVDAPQSLGHLRVQPAAGQRPRPPQAPSQHTPHPLLRGPPLTPASALLPQQSAPSPLEPAPAWQYPGCPLGGSAEAGPPGPGAREALGNPTRRPQWSRPRHMRRWMSVKTVREPSSALGRRPGAQGLPSSRLLLGGQCPFPRLPWAWLQGFLGGAESPETPPRACDCALPGKGVSHTWCHVGVGKGRMPESTGTRTRRQTCLHTQHAWNHTCAHRLTCADSGTRLRPRAQTRHVHLAHTALHTLPCSHAHPWHTKT